MKKEITIFEVMSIIEKSYLKILLINPVSDTFREIKITNQEKNLGDTFSLWWDRYAKMGNVHPDDVDKFLEFRKNIKDAAAMQYRRKKADDWEWVYLEILPYDDSTFLMLIRSNDIYKDRLNKIIEIEYDNFHDSLTRVKNRRAYDIAINNDKESAWVAFFDLNDLKKYNDLMSHEAGDRYIQACARVLKEFFRKDDIYRYGGDEFIVICKCGASRFADIKSHINRRFMENGVNVSFGSCYYDSKSNKRTLSETVREAERRMYIDKKEQKEKRVSM